MSRRITMQDLQVVADRINVATKSPTDAYDRIDSPTGFKLVARIGCYLFDGAYGGVALHQMLTAGGAVRDVFGVGHTTKRNLYDLMQAYLRGLEDGRRA